jgi:hypothetical protein
MFRRDWTTSSNIDNYFTLNNKHNQEDLCIQWRNQQTCTSNNRNQIQRRSDVYICFIVDSLIQCEFCSVNLISRSWRTWKRNHITPTYLNALARLSETPVCTSQLSRQIILLTIVREDLNKLKNWRDNHVAYTLEGVAHSTLLHSTLRSSKWRGWTASLQLSLPWANWTGSPKQKKNWSCSQHHYPSGATNHHYQEPVWKAVDRESHGRQLIRAECISSAGWWPGSTDAVTGLGDALWPNSWEPSLHCNSYWPKYLYLLELCCPCTFVPGLRACAHTFSNSI